MKKTILLLTLAVATPALAARLPQAVIPSHYAITMTPDLTNDTFNGEEAIDVDVREPRLSSILMHAIGLDIVTASVTQNGASVAATSGQGDARLRPDDEMIALALARPIAAGPATIRIAFSGKLNPRLRGFYLSHTQKRKYAVTQFESTDARRAFPSFDEPAMKATFDITLVVDKSDTAISNTRIVSDTRAGRGKHAIKFATTPRLSTYLVAMLVGDFQCREGGVDGVPIRVCGTPGHEALGGFALAAAEQSIAFYDKYYGIKYPFGKLDLVGIPDFEAGAMENAGAVTFRETSLFVDEKTASPEQRRRVAETVAHEIAHMWFGDLVTMKWWDDIWLNEGFATFMSNKPIAAWKPEWHLELESAGGSRRAVSLDAQRATRAIRTDAETSAAINSLFDGIAYGKTAAVLRMIESWVGEEAFRDGIRAYLAKYSYSNAAAEDLFSTLTASTKRPVDAVMRTFVVQPGAPLLHATDSCVNGERHIDVAQERFLMHADKDAAAAETWTIPLCARTLGQPASAEQCAIVGKKTETVTQPGCDAPLLLNAGGRGYFIVDYSPQQRAAIRAHLRDLTAEEQVDVHGDEWLLVQADRRDVGDYLAFLEALPRPAAAQLVQAFSGNISFLEQRLVNDSNRARWQAAVREIARGQAQPVWASIANESDDDVIRRAAVLRLLGFNGGDPKLVSEAREVAQKALRDPSSLKPALARPAIEIAAATGNAAMFDEVLNAYESGPASQRWMFLAELASMRDPEAIRRAIDYVLSPKVRSQDMPGMLASLLNNSAARPATWSAIKDHWKEITDRVPTALHVLIGSLGGFCDPAMHADVEEFFKMHPAGEGTAALKRTLEAIDTCVAFRNAQQEAFNRWLAR